MPLEAQGEKFTCPSLPLTFLFIHLFQGPGSWTLSSPSDRGLSTLWELDCLPFWFTYQVVSGTTARFSYAKVATGAMAN